LRILAEENYQDSREAVASLIYQKYGKRKRQKKQRIVLAEKSAMSLKTGDLISLRETRERDCQGELSRGKGKANWVDDKQLLPGGATDFNGRLPIEGRKWLPESH